MLYEAKLPADELQFLDHLIGCSIERIVGDGWSIEIQLQDRILHCFPEEEATPDNEHELGGVDRLRVELIHTSTMQSRPFIAAELGKVISISVLSLLAGFTPPTPVPSTPLLGTVIPPGIAYGHFYFRPEFRELVTATLSMKQAIIDWDIGIEIVTERCSSIVLYTKGYFVRASMNGLPSQDWARDELLSKRAFS